MSEWSIAETEFDRNSLRILRKQISYKSLYRKKLFRMLTSTTYFKIIKVDEVWTFLYNYRKNDKVCGNECNQVKSVPDSLVAWVEIRRGVILINQIGAGKTRTSADGIWSEKRVGSLGIDRGLAGKLSGERRAL